MAKKGLICKYLASNHGSVLYKLEEKRISGLLLRWNTMFTFWVFFFLAQIETNFWT